MTSILTQYNKTKVHRHKSLTKQYPSESTFGQTHWLKTTQYKCIDDMKEEFYCNIQCILKNTVNEKG